MILDTKITNQQQKIQIQQFFNQYQLPFQNIFNRLSPRQRNFVTYSDLNQHSKSFKSCDLSIAETVHYLTTEIEPVVGSQESRKNTQNTKRISLYSLFYAWTKTIGILLY